LVAGRTVVFGADTGVCVRGHVILRHDVIADQWIAVSFSGFFCVVMCDYLMPHLPMWL